MSRVLLITSLAAAAFLAITRRRRASTFSIAATNTANYYRSLHISYPTAEDRARAAKAGVEPGGDIMVHGLPNGLGWIGSKHRIRDWTDGCIAVTDEEMDEIWRAVPDGTVIEINP